MGDWRTEHRGKLLLGTAVGLGYLVAKAYQWARHEYPAIRAENERRAHEQREHTEYRYQYISGLTDDDLALLRSIGIRDRYQRNDATAVIPDEPVSGGSNLLASGPGYEEVNESEVPASLRLRYS